MSTRGIVPRANAPDNEVREGRALVVPVRPRRLSARAALTAPRTLAVLLLLAPLAPSLSDRRVDGTLSGLAVLVLVLVAVEGPVTRSLVPGQREPTRVAFRAVYAVLALVAAVTVPEARWWLSLALAYLVVQAALSMSGHAVLAVTLTAAATNLAAWVLAGGQGSDGGGSVSAAVEAWGISLVVLPGLAALTHARTRRASASLDELQRTVERLREVGVDLQRSQAELQQWNTELQHEVERQTGALEERNRYLSIINAVSFALAEPMDDERALERAVRLVARLLGVRAAQAYTRPRTGRDINLFVTVAPEDLHAPRLPETLLRSVATSGHPVSSSERAWAGDGPLPDLGESYQVVPLVAKGRVLGSFALIGAGTLANDDDGRHLLLLVGREMGIALENARLYQGAVEKASREEFLTEVAHLLNGSGRGERALPEVLEAFRCQTAADEALLVVLPEGSRDVVVAGGAIADGAAPRLDALARSLTRIVSDRGGPVVLGLGGEAPLSDQLVAQGVTALAIAPIFTTRGHTSEMVVQRFGDEDLPVQPVPELTGALAVLIGARGEWGEEQTTLLERVTDIVARRIQADEFVAVQQQRIRELTGLAEVARTMQSGADPERLYHGFASALRRLIAYEALYVARVDETAWLTDLPAFAQSGRSTASPLFTGHEANHPWFSLRMPTVWTRGASEPPAFLPAETRYAVVLPMRPKGQTLGLVVVAVPRPIRADQARIVEQAVEQLSLALDGATLYQQATARASHIQALSNLARIVASVVNLREAFAAFSEEVRWLIPFDQAAMLLLDEAEQTVEPYATYPDGDDASSPVELVRSIASVVVEASSAVTLRRDDPRHAALDWSILGDDAREVAAVPIRQAGRNSAVFALVTNQPGTYGPADLDALNEVAGLLAVTIDRLRLYEQADYSAKHDLLTDLPNYRYLQERIQALSAPLTERVPMDDRLVDGPGDDRRDGPMRAAVLVIDMDNLKLFNDTLGHEVGDQVIRAVARVLRSSCRPEDFVARTGGDEFVVLMQDADAETALRVADRVHAALADAHREIEGAESRIGVSIGVAVRPGDADSVAALLPAADRAMYDAKFAGGQRTRLASDRGDTTEPRALRGRSIRLADTLIRTLAAGGSLEEMAALALAHRWAGSVIGRMRLAPELLPQVRLVLASGASRRFEAQRGGRDQALARYLVDRIEEDWEGLGEEQVGMQLAFLASTLLELAWMTMATPSGGGLTIDEALDRVVEAHPTAVSLPVWSVLKQVVRKGADRRRAA